ncbi:hypothetical protein D3870_07455 [Noviherbaspirillum cavernae]|uniref:Carboxypeptidase regulatory-like domain-containing protein n=1 Tax=Noviherbaspirillum cavernae TaxID=2320862 RepID=A0A418X040_9BURK|nr:hypothetical protein [Noviherbaspirillum cavernae]RJG05874.1 hypothetical protein D3870_07455 [Noviherbaspirillum cavernae]
MRHLILMLPIALVACATTGSSGGNVAIETTANGQSLPGVQCVVNNYNGSWNVTTPATINVGSANGDLRIVCDKEGYRTSEMVFRPSGPLGSSVGLGVGGGGGNVGVGVGLSVPIALGSGGYPSRVTVNLNPQ